MKYFVALILFLFFTRGFAQDSLFFRSKRIVIAQVKEINPETIKYSFTSDPIRLYVVAKDSVFKIKYPDGTIELYEMTVKAESEPQQKTKRPKRIINYDSLPLIKNSVRYYFTDITFRKISFGYERMLNKEYSIDIDAFYKILSDDQNNFYATDWVSSIYKKSEGGELKVGASKHFYKGKRRLSLGGAISYRQQTMANVVLDGMQDKYRPDDGIYNISQTKRGTGLFLKFNFQFQRHRSCFEFFVIPGTYATFTKNKYLSWTPRYALPASATTTDPNNIPKLQTWYMKDGFAFLPYLNFGFSFVFKQKPKSNKPEN